jgi:hypothetical protein
MPNGFGRACPSGNVMVELSGGEPYAHGFECKCGAEHEDGHKCRYCLEDITSIDCEGNGGVCAECMQFETEEKTYVDIAVESKEVYSGVCQGASTSEVHQSVEGVH